MRNFSARETEWLLELDGIELASFQQRALAFIIDGIIFTIILMSLLSLVLLLVLWYRSHHGHPIDMSDFFAKAQVHINVDGSKVEQYSNSESLKGSNEIISPILLILYFGILLWKGKGRTPGKRIMRIRVVSLMHRHITFWHAVERALGYGAAALEGGFGFVQFFIHPYRRCAQDRLAETIVVTERGYQAMQHKLEHPLIPDGPEGEGLLSQ